MMPDTILCVEGLSVDFRGDSGWVNCTNDVSFEIGFGETVALVGESGSGKSVTAMSILGLLPGNARLRGTIRFQSDDLLHASESTKRSIRGKEIAMIFQEPMSALNPVYTIETQLSDVIRHTQVIGKRDIHGEVIRLLRAVHMPDPETKCKSYPHQLSGGQLQRAMIAMAISGNPKLLIADEPTTALDVTVQAEILDLLLELQAKLGMSILLITHDMGVVADVAKRVIVMEKGQLVEQAEVDTLFSNPSHPYTRRLLAAVPYLGQGQGRDAPVTSETEPALVLDNISVDYGKRSRRSNRKRVTAVDAVSLTVNVGEIVGLVGESGSGKTSIGKAIAGLTSLSDGSVTVTGQVVEYKRRRARRQALNRVSMVFQNPASSLNPRLPVWRNITDPLRWKGVERRRSALMKRAKDLLELVDLSPSIADRYPHELSGGQQQRIGIARALAVEPVLMIADEPTSSLDVSVQATVLRLLLDLQARMGFSCLFISHDLAVIEILADRVAVINHGSIVEVGDTRLILSNPSDAYTQRLMAAAPVPDPAAQRQRRYDRLTRKVGSNNVPQG